MSDLKAKKMILPSFCITKICDAKDKGAVVRSIPETHKSHSYSYNYKLIEKPLSFDDEELTYCYNLMPIVVDAGGELWREACLYILARLEKRISPKMSTFDSIAGDLAAFKEYLDSNEIDYKKFPVRRLYRPTYRYRGYLLQKIMSGELSPKTATRRISAVVAYYRWLIQEGQLKPDHKPWEEGDIYIKLADTHGFSVTKDIKTTDVSICVPSQNDPYDGTIDDGGKLRPLTVDEQECLIDALVQIGSPEMNLVFLLALFTGARMQTALTFQVRTVRPVLGEGEFEIRIPIGYGTGIDNKNDKRMTLFVPLRLYNRLRIYSFSERSRIRRVRSGCDDDSQYLFLTNRGMPYYKSNKDKRQFDADNQLRHEKSGQTIRQFMSDTLLPVMQTKLGKKFKFRFHDLRASYGMNMTDQQLSLVHQGTVTLHEAREFVRVRMGHESSATTDLYLNFRQNLKIISKAQESYEGHLKTLLDKAMEDNS